jgi:uncharacterized protein Yka (UPF0111/DUF47 family)
MLSRAMSNLESTPAVGSSPSRHVTPGLLKAIRSFLSGDRVWDLLELQAAAIHRGGDTSEVEAERVARVIATELRRLVVPIDREDLYELSAALERVSALRWRSSRAMAMLDVEDRRDSTGRLEEMLIGCTLAIQNAIGHLRSREYARVIDLSRELRKLQREAEIAHDEAISSLLSEDDSRGAHVVVCAKAPLDDLAATIRECGAVGKLFAFLAVKNG